MTTKKELLRLCEKHGWPTPHYDAFGRAIVAVTLSDVEVDAKAMKAAPRSGRPSAGAPMASVPQFRAWIAREGLDERNKGAIADRVNSLLGSKYDRTVIYKWLNPASPSAAGRGIPPAVAALIARSQAKVKRARKRS